MLGQGSELSLFFKFIADADSNIKIEYPVTISRNMIVPKTNEGYAENVLASDLVSFSLKDFKNIYREETLYFTFNVRYNFK